MTNLTGNGRLWAQGLLLSAGSAVQWPDHLALNLDAARGNSHLNRVGIRFLTYEVEPSGRALAVGPLLAVPVEFADGYEIGVEVGVYVRRLRAVNRSTMALAVSGGSVFPILRLSSVSLCAFALALWSDQSVHPILGIQISAGPVTASARQH